jgi:hypothetical protein
MLNITLRTGAVGAGATSRYGYGSTKMMRLLAAPTSALQHWLIFNNIGRAHRHDIK